MTVLSQQPTWATLAAVDGLLVYTVPFRVDAQEDLKVTHETSQGAMNDLVLGNDFSVTNLGQQAATLNLNVAIPSGDYIHVRRETLAVQPVDLVEGGQLTAEVLERALDRGALVDQDVREVLERVPQTPFPGGARGLVMPKPAVGKAIGWDSNGQLANITVSGDGGAGGNLTGRELTLVPEAVGVSPAVPVPVAGRVLAASSDGSSFEWIEQATNGGGGGSSGIDISSDSPSIAIPDATALRLASGLHGEANGSQMIASTRPLVFYPEHLPNNPVMARTERVDLKGNIEATAYGPGDPERMTLEVPPLVARNEDGSQALAKVRSIHAGFGLLWSLADQGTYPGGAILAVNPAEVGGGGGGAAQSAGFQGVHLYRSTSQSVTGSGRVKFTTEVFDTSGFADLASNDQRITIPTEVGGKYVQLTAVVRSALAAGGDFAIYKNGAQLQGGRITAGGQDDYEAITTPPVQVSAGDYFELHMFGDQTINYASLALAVLDTAGIVEPVTRLRFAVNTSEPAGTAVGDALFADGGLWKPADSGSSPWPRVPNSFWIRDSVGYAEVMTERHLGQVRSRRQTGSSFTLGDGDIGKLVEISSSSAKTITVAALTGTWAGLHATDPAQSTAHWRAEVLTLGSGATTFVAGSGLTLTGAVSGTGDGDVFVIEWAAKTRARIWKGSAS